MLHVVLFEPAIPNNTGNIGRTCVALNATLHLIGKLGFMLSDKYLKRAGLDYWQYLTYHYYESWDFFIQQTQVQLQQLFFFENYAEKSYISAPYTPDSFLVLGGEIEGLPEWLFHTYKDHFYSIPMIGQTRSLNLAVSTAIVLYECHRQQTSQA